MLKLETAGSRGIDSSPKPWVIVVGAGAVVQEKFTPNVLDRLGPGESRVIIDINPKRLQDYGMEDRGQRVAADAVNGLPINVKGLSEKERTNFTAIVTTPDHLGPIRSLIEAGVQKFIVEKPLVNNAAEIDVLMELLRVNPDVRIYPLDFYIQKAAPLLVLTGAITPDDPRFSWVTMANGEAVDSNLSGSIDQLIGEIEGIEVTIIEGGKFGLPDLAKRRWLEEDNLRGGMLLDLGTHALAPLFAAGIISQGGVRVKQSLRYVLGPDRQSFVKATASQAEIYSQALLTAEKRGWNIPCLITVGKTFHDGGMWKTNIRGTTGDISMGLRTGQRLTVEPKEGESFQLRLRKNDPYGMAFQEAQMYFDEFPGFDGNLGAMLAAIRIIDQIKSRANES